MNNGRRHPKTARQKARNLRKNGYTHREIAKEIGCAYSMAHVWTKDIAITKRQKEEIEKRRKQPDYVRNRKKGRNLREDIFPLFGKSHIQKMNLSLKSDSFN